MEDISAMIKVKICGLKSKSSVQQAVLSGADYIGFVFYNKSPRYINPIDVNHLSNLIPKKIKKVGLFVDVPLHELEAILTKTQLDYLQLHGQETPQIVTDLKRQFGIPIIKAIGIADKSDLHEIDRYEMVCDKLLIDTKASPLMNLPGGNGLTFDWGLISNRKFKCPWLLAGGLTSKNVTNAINISGATQVDVSSGVEIELGMKDNPKIANFINVVKNGDKDGR